MTNLNKRPEPPMSGRKVFLEWLIHGGFFGLFVTFVLRVSLRLELSNEAWWWAVAGFATVYSAAVITHRRFEYLRKLVEWQEKEFDRLYTRVVSLEEGARQRLR